MSKDYTIPVYKSFKSIKEKNDFSFPYIFEKYFDGVRCYIKKCENNIEIFDTKNVKILSCSHIIENSVIKEFFSSYPNGVLEGDLISTDSKSSIIKKIKAKKLTTNDLKTITENIKFCCNDLYIPEKNDLTYVDRKTIIVNIINFKNTSLSEDNIFCINGIHIIGNDIKCVAISSLEDIDKLKSKMGDKTLILRYAGEYLMGKKSKNIKY